MEPAETDRREFCARCGWVGRKVFQRDRHDLCEAPVDAEDGEEAVVEPSPSPSSSSKLKRGTRHRGVPPKKTLAVRRITRLDLAVGRAELHVLGADAPYNRPKTRADCTWCGVCQLVRDGKRDGLVGATAGRLVCGHRIIEVVFRSRPCVFVACKHALYLDVSEIGSIIFNFPHLEPEQMPVNASCSLDLALVGGMTLDQVGDAQAVTRERVRQIEVKALVELLSRLKARGIDRSDIVGVLLRHVAGPGELAGSAVDGEVPRDVATILGGGGGDGL